MPIFVNGLMLPEELIRQEAESLNFHPEYPAIADWRIPRPENFVVHDGAGAWYYP